jgi:hypothetical protein
MLSAPDDLLVDLNSEEDHIVYLLSEGVIVEAANIMDESGTRRYRLAAPLLRPLLYGVVGSSASSQAQRCMAFPRLQDGKVNLVATVLECLPYFSLESLFHPYALKKDGTPCEYSYHFQLYNLLSNRASEGGWRVIGETRNATFTGPLRRLDILIASNGHKYGIELLCDGVGYKKHISEQAPAYIEQQDLISLLVLNFVVGTPTPVSLLADEHTDVDCMEVYVNPSQRTMTPFLLKHGSLQAQSTIDLQREDTEDSTGTHAIAIGMQNLSVSQISLRLHLTDERVELMLPLQAVVRDAISACSQQLAPEYLQSKSIKLVRYDSGGWLRQTDDRCLTELANHRVAIKCDESYLNLEVIV